MAPLVTTKDGLGNLYQIIGLVCQTFVYGIYATLVLLSAHYMVKKSLKSPIRRYLFIMSLFMFFICTLFWIFKILRTGYYFYGSYIADPPQMPTILSPINHLAVIFAAVCTINYVLSDCTVLWRAWVLCRTDTKYLLYIPLFFLIACVCTCTATIAVRITIESMRVGDGPEPPHLTRALDIVQVGNLIFSLIVNISSTLVVALKAWRHRRWIKNDLALDHRKTKSEKVLVLLIESGLLYSICGVIALVSTLIRLPIGTLGDMYTPVNFQIAGMYPILVLLLVSRGNSLEETSAFQGVTIGGTPHRGPPRSQFEIETMQFRVQTVNTSTDSYYSRTTEDTL